MFYIWHTLLIILFLTIGFILGYKLAKKQYKKEEDIPKGKCPFGFSD
jgi:uncharacterized protein YneF (UPF0154 family)